MAFVSLDLLVEAFEGGALEKDLGQPVPNSWSKPFDDWARRLSLDLGNGGVLQKNRVILHSQLGLTRPSPFSTFGKFSECSSFNKIGALVCERLHRLLMINCVDPCSLLRNDTMREQIRINSSQSSG